MHRDKARKVWRTPFHRVGKRMDDCHLRWSYCADIEGLVSGNG